MHTRTAGLTPEHAYEVQIPNAVPLSYIAVMEIIGKLQTCCRAGRIDTAGRASEAKLRSRGSDLDSSVV